jgi:hypothetical protein
VDGVEGFLDVNRIECDERILSYLGAVDSFVFDLVDGELAKLLIPITSVVSRSNARNESEGYQHEQRE